MFGLPISAYPAFCFDKVTIARLIYTPTKNLYTTNITRLDKPLHFKPHLAFHTHIKGLGLRPLGQKIIIVIWKYIYKALYLHSVIAVDETITFVLY